MTVGYSSTPLAKKLGLKGRVFAHNLPESVKAEIAQTQAVDWVSDINGATDAHIFVTFRLDLETQLALARRVLPDKTTVWISWPKKTSKISTDITEDGIRELCLPMGWVDVKVCAVDAIWSGLKLVVRKELRNTTKAQAASFASREWRYNYG